MQPEPIFTLFLTHPVLALIRLFRLDTTPTLLASLHQAVDELLALMRTSAATRSLPPNEQFGGCQAGDCQVVKDEYEAYAAADAAKPNSAPCSSEDLWHPWEAVLRDPFAARIVLRFALCRSVYTWAARLRAGAQHARNGHKWGVAASACGESAGKGGGGCGQEGGACGASDTHLPQALPELPEALAPDAPLLAKSVDILLKDLCGVEV